MAPPFAGSGRRGFLRPGARCARAFAARSGLGAGWRSPPALAAPRFARGCPRRRTPRGGDANSSLRSSDMRRLVSPTPSASALLKLAPGRPQPQGAAPARIGRQNLADQKSSRFRSRAVGATQSRSRPPVDSPRVPGAAVAVEARVDPSRPAEPAYGQPLHPSVCALRKIA